MNYVTMDGALNTHDTFVKWLDELEKKTEYIEIVTPYSDGSDDELICEIREYILETKKVGAWWGTKTNRKNSTLFRIKANKKVFDLLRGYHTFCISVIHSEYGCSAETTDFGDKDIAFFDDRKEPIFYTTTHEGYLQLRTDCKSLLKRIEKK